MDNFILGFEKRAFFFNKPKHEPEMTEDLAKGLMKNFRAHARQPYTGEMSEADQRYIAAVADLERKTGVPNERIYAYMNDHHWPKK